MGKAFAKLIGVTALFLVVIGVGVVTFTNSVVDNSPYSQCVAKGKAWYAENNATQYDSKVEQRCTNNTNAFGAD